MDIGRLFPADWYWKADDGRLFSSSSASAVQSDDAGFASWSAIGLLPTVWPRDDSGQQTDAALKAVLNPYGIWLDSDAVPPSVSRAQAKIQLLRTKGSTKTKSLLDDVSAAVEAAGGELAIWFADAPTWQRGNTYVAQLAEQLGLTASRVDDLFRAAAQIEA